MDELYLAEWRELMAEARDAHATATAALREGDGYTPADAVEALSGAKDTIGRADDSLKQLEVMARSGQGVVTRKQARAMRAGLKKLRATVDADLARYQRSALLEDDLEFGLGGGGAGGAGNGERQRLLDAGARAERNTDVLAQAGRRVGEIEEVALGITEELARNRATIEGARDKARQTTAQMGFARSILRRMDQREGRKKLVVRCIWAFLGVLLLILVYAMLF